MNTFVQLLLVMLGGAIGSALRFLTYLAYARWTKISTFPIATLTVNVVGCFLIALIVEVGISTSLIGANTRVFLTVGVMGGLTTYSSFNHDVVEALRRGDHLAGALIAGVTFTACLAAGILSLIAGRALIRH